MRFNLHALRYGRVASDSQLRLSLNRDLTHAAVTRYREVRMVAIMRHLDIGALGRLYQVSTLRHLNLLSVDR